MAQTQAKKSEVQSSQLTEITAAEAEPFIRTLYMKDGKILGPYHPLITGIPRPENHETTAEYFRRRVVEMGCDPETLQPLTPIS